MFVLGLLTCIVLRAFSAQAKVVETFDECSRFFYKDTAPRGMDQNAKKICQRLEKIKETRVSDDDNTLLFAYYATLYSVYHRIPLYSAYTLKRSCSDTTGRTNKWHLEPQISKTQSPIDYMVPEHQNNQDTLKVNQAISSDYSETGYDRGQLNPNSFHCGNGPNATFTLTNAAPMDACFNRIQWKNWESTLKSFLIKKLDSEEATAYIVTGTVPDANLRIPQKGMSEEPERVTVPSHIWTAVCYKHNYYDKNSFSFGYIGENLPGGKVNLMSVSQLNNRLNQLYKLSNIKIFVDDCFEDNNKFNEVKKAFQKLINLPLNQGVQVNSDVQNMYRALQSVSTDSLTPEESVEVTDMSVKLTFSSLSAYSTVTENLKVSTGSACFITNYGQKSVECQLGSKKRKIAVDGSPCSSNTGGETKRCCSTPCLYKDNLKGYRCYSGQKEIACSPQYSLITYKGERCMDDHPCGTYDKDYYWCNTISGRSDYCSPLLWRSKAKNGQYCRNNNACAKYGESQQWCYTDDGKKHECCTSDDCYSTVNGKTCKPDHPCGKHGKDYLWCWTTQGSVDYCCTSCG
ncbi:endonuclease domain-containing 1 protein-like isoform X2 [Ctenopharyngodon idella]|uniref:endonuclease domain-containing 1 protein-like isoform X2 n=1 Tax=Ctenopharyngodon idella TaxID=7959 RepID=UPI0022303E5F|nr:endonuclease domain-containing 1 protein-like isoform X2 [Ctenopharyngodon idella]